MHMVNHVDRHLVGADFGPLNNMNSTFSSLNNTAAVLLAVAIKQLYPNVVCVQAHTNEDGFHYDFDFQGHTFSTKDFSKVEKVMKKLVQHNVSVSAQVANKVELSELFANNPYKLAQLATSGTVYYVTLGEQFTDVISFGEFAPLKDLKAISLLKTGGVYWLNDANQVQLLRISGIAFSDQASLTAHLDMLAALKAADHRQIGHDLQIFRFDQQIGAGLPIWLKNGYTIKNLVTQFINQIQKDHGVDLVSTPVLGTKSLYETSGHWDHYQENIFPPIQLENTEYILRPMTCPHHINLFQKSLWSYKDLPQIYGENALLHRYEHSGGLTGLERVRAMELIDSHAFVRPDQIIAVIKQAYAMIKLAMAGFNLKFHRVDLALRDVNNHEKYHQNEQFWQTSEAQLQAALVELNIPYQVMVGDAAFYGPKLDFQMETVHKKIITISTIQLDCLLPQKFNLHYVDQMNEHQVPVIIHIGIIGTLERFIAMYLEQTKGVLPFWLTPIQVLVIPINNDKHLSAASELVQKLAAHQIRVHLDDKFERLGKKIRQGQVQKIPYQIIIGDQEVANHHLVTYRKYGDEQSYQASWEQFITELVANNHFPKTK